MCNNDQKRSSKINLQDFRRYVIPDELEGHDNALLRKEVQYRVQYIIKNKLQTDNDIICLKLSSIIENHLYRNAKSSFQYSDYETLEERVRLVANHFILKMQLRHRQQLAGCGEKIKCAKRLHSTTDSNDDKKKKLKHVTGAKVSSLETGDSNPCTRSRGLQILQRRLGEKIYNEVMNLVTTLLEIRSTGYYQFITSTAKKGTSCNSSTFCSHGEIPEEVKNIYFHTKLVVSVELLRSSTIAIVESNDHDESCVDNLDWKRLICEAKQNLLNYEEWKKRHYKRMAS
mmetsp:Transcript_10398/g.13176  ORF Transcript_10398/g.13176 Transcript_10398/m.13176 type:complete len:286 (+) Transcript_10398:109-966(+)